VSEASHPQQPPPAAPAAARAFVVAIDGPAASGKSSTAHWVAERLGFRHVDSGAIYRALTYLALCDAGPPPDWTEDAVTALAPRVRLAPAPGGFEPIVDGDPATDAIRGIDVTRQVSRVAQMPAVRAWVNEQVRRAAAEHDVVVDGRDIGTVVFPDAPLKIFLVADPWERARRRLVQQLGRRPTEDEIAEETERLVQRDARDSTQTMQAKDAVLIDTTYLTQPEQVDRIVAITRSLLRQAAPETTSPPPDAPIGS
jgi:cytidylate kinase